MISDFRPFDANAAALNSSRVAGIDPVNITDSESDIIEGLTSSETHWSTKLDSLQEIDDILTSGTISKEKAMLITDALKEALSQMVSNLAMFADIVPSWEI